MYYFNLIIRYAILSNSPALYLELVHYRLNWPENVYTGFRPCNVYIFIIIFAVIFGGSCGEGEIWDFVVESCGSRNLNVCLGRSWGSCIFKVCSIVKFCGFWKLSWDTKITVLSWITVSCFVVRSWIFWVLIFVLPWDSGILNPTCLFCREILLILDPDKCFCREIL